MNRGAKERVSVYEWYLPDLELDTFAEKKEDENVCLYTKENQRRLFLQWDEEAYEELEKNLEYGSLLLRFFADNLEDDKQRTLFELGTLKGVVESFEHLLYNKGEELRLLQAKYTFFSTVKHLDEVVFALETHGSMTQTELRKYMRGMNASTLSEAMKKILDTGLVLATAMGKYKVYTLTDTGLKYGRLARRTNEKFDLPGILKLLQTVIDHTPAGIERKKLADKVAALFVDGEDVSSTYSANKDIVNAKFEDKLQNAASLVSGTDTWAYIITDVNGGEHIAKRRMSVKQGALESLFGTGLNTVRRGNSIELWVANNRREPVSIDYLPGSIISCLTN
ncbi:MAG: hypothetical protein IKZ43_08325 [Acidaminococcaceae bacterium]|nr:hypothetical protein [Acidaminococcaceae bacterium]